MAAGAGDISVGISPPRTGTPDSIGDFRIVREIGRGGMGVVYEAVQQSLGRTVALKVLPPSINLSESQIGRFHREAQSAGRLHHTNIVPVFGVGEHDGMHYYVMQCIQGQGLDSILNSFHVVEGAFVSTNQTTEGNTGPSNTAVNEKSKSGSTTEQTINVGRRRIEIQTYETTRYWQSVAEIGRQVTDDALQHAHDQNTLHRDIKPANLLLDVHDTVWITDFGLAKSLEQDAFNITQTGEVLGTPRYMSPEQLRGKAEKRSDLYSLGLTLYEMLSLRPAFDAQDRASLLKQVMYEQPPPLDKVNPRIPQDLVTVVHKAIAKEPERRYQTAGLLRDDLERFIEGRPILARRTSNLMRLWLWSKRNPVIAGLSAATFLLILLSAVIGWKGYADTRRALRKVDVQLDQTRKERGRAEDNLNLALQAFDEVFQQIGGDASLDAGGGKLALSRDMANMMESLLIFYTHFIERNADRKGLELEEIRAHTRMGQLYLRLGQFPEARASLENALILYDELPEEKRPDLFTRDQARLLRRIGTTYMTWFETSQARDLFGQAKLILGRALENDSENVELLFEFANVCQEFAMLAPPKGMHEAAPSA
ncbi:MAG: serine/threonine-protein kinase, partial [Planctomycetota bacterium]|nr:serine/threonine-protein kinase [Planctomycetota bacterium]